MGRDLRLVLLLQHRSPAFHLDLPYNAAPKPVPRGTTQSSLLVEQLGHRLLVRDRARPAGGYPLPMGRQRRLDLGLLKEARWGVTLHRLKPPQVGKWDDRGCFAAQMDDLVGAGVTRRRCSHGTTVPRSSDIHTQPITPPRSRSPSVMQASRDGYPQVAPRARLERATYCLGGRLPASLNLRLGKPSTVLVSREWP
jgi:hypothetical protein